MAILSASPIDSPGIFDVIVIGGIISPGVVLLTGGGRPFEWDKKKTAGTQGNTKTYRGWDTADDIVAKFQFWTSEQIFTFTDSFLPLLRYDATKTNPLPVDIYHPNLAMNDVYSVITKEIGPLVHEGAQLWTCTVKFEEFRPAKDQNVTHTPEAAAANANPDDGAPEQPPVLDQQDIEIIGLHEEAIDPGV